MYVLEEGFKWSQWAIGWVENWQYVAIWALCWRLHRSHGRCRVQCPDHSFTNSGDVHSKCKAYSHQFCNVHESLVHECGQDCPDSLLVVWGYRQDRSTPEKVRPSTCLHFIGISITSMIVSIAYITHRTLAKITYSHAAIVYRCKTSINAIYIFWTKSPPEIRRMFAWRLAEDRLTCPTNFRGVSSKFPSCSIIVFMINSGVQVSICSNWNFGSYSLYILLRYTTNRHER